MARDESILSLVAASDGDAFAGSAALDYLVVKLLHVDGVLGHGLQFSQSELAWQLHSLVVEVSEKR